MTAFRSTGFSKLEALKAKPQIFVLCIEHRALYKAGTIQLMIAELNKAAMWHAR